MWIGGERSRRLLSSLLLYQFILNVVSGFVGCRSGNVEIFHANLVILLFGLISVVVVYVNLVVLTVISVSVFAFVFGCARSTQLIKSFFQTQFVCLLSVCRLVSSHFTIECHRMRSSFLVTQKRMAIGYVSTFFAYLVHSLWSWWHLYVFGYTQHARNIRIFVRSIGFIDGALYVWRQNNIIRIRWWSFFGFCFRFAIADARCSCLTKFYQIQMPLKNNWLSNNQHQCLPVWWLRFSFSYDSMHWSRDWFCNWSQRIENVMESISSNEITAHGVPCLPSAAPQSNYFQIRTRTPVGIYYRNLVHFDSKSYSVGLGKILIDYQWRVWFPRNQQFVSYEVSIAVVL